jgi:hypothetical protein
MMGKAIRLPEEHLVALSYQRCSAKAPQPGIRTEQPVKLRPAWVEHRL